MLQLDRITAWLFIFVLIAVVPSISYITSIDELGAIAFLGIALFDCIVNGAWGRYKFLWTVVLIITLYLIYTLLFQHFNILPAILFDYTVEIKPFIPFAVIIVIGLNFSEFERQLIYWLSIFIGGLMVICLIGGQKFLDVITGGWIHYPGMIIVLCVSIIIMVSIRSDGTLPRKTYLIVVTLLLGGLLCGRSKYYGEFCFILFMLFVWKPGMLGQFKWKTFLLLAGLILLIIAVSWEKFSFYFLKGSTNLTEGFDPNNAETYARPALYYVGFLLLGDFFPFGTGLASFGSGATMHYYSDLYYDYGLNYIYGLSPEYPNFICDTFYPILAQFGVVGVGLFIWFWVYLYQLLRTMLRDNPTYYRYYFLVGSCVIAFELIECIASAGFTSTAGMLGTAILGAICHKGYEIKLQQKEMLQENNQQQ